MILLKLLKFSPEHLISWKCQVHAVLGFNKRIQTTKNNTKTPSLTRAHTHTKKNKTTQNTKTQTVLCMELLKQHSSSSLTCCSQGWNIQNITANQKKISVVSSSSSTHTQRHTHSDGDTALPPTPVCQPTHQTSRQVGHTYHTGQKEHRTGLNM